MKRFYILFSFIFITGLSNAQTETTVVDTSWKSGGFIGLNFSQVSLNDWAAGGDNSFSLATNINLFANYKKDKVEWSNNLSVNYALLRTASETRKSDDRIDFVTKYGRQSFDHWYLTALANFKSQFFNGYVYPNDSVPVSRFFAPAYVLASIGLDYKPNDNFSFYISPATGKFTFINDERIADAGTYGNDAAAYDSNGNLVAHGKKIKSEFGAYAKIAYKQDIMENVTLIAKVDLFNNYTDKDAGNAKNVDVNGELTINMKVNKFIAATFNVLAIYDNDIDTHPELPGIQRRLQVKEVIGLGFSYKF